VTFSKSGEEFACKESARGTWALLAAPDVWSNWRELAADDDCLQKAPSLRLNLVFSDEAGGEIARGGFEHYADGWGGGTVLIDTLFDYDGDGNAEVIVAEVHDGEGSFSEKYSVFTSRAGAIVPYAPAANFKILDVQDADADQRPDLVIRRHEATTSERGIEGQSTTFPALAHSLPSGGFDIRDREAEAFVERHCSTLPSGALAKPRGRKRNDVATGHALVCARWRGAPEAALLAELACSSFSEDVTAVEDPENVPEALPCPSWWRRWLEEER
jgi:hypothetical protein